MGVAELFSWLKRKWPYLLLRILRKTIFSRKPGAPPERREIPLFFAKFKVDGNALLHPAAQWTYGYGEFAGNQQGIPDTIPDPEDATKTIPNPRIVDRKPATPQLAAERLLDLIMEGWDLIEPTRRADPKNRKLKSLYIALDGPPPSAKTQQQRTRRFLSTARTISNEEIVEEMGEDLREVPGKVEGFDSSFISPGTPWMDAVDEYIRKWLRENIEILPEDTRYWSHRTVGEGEHKLIATSEQQGGAFKGLKHVRDEYSVIYGNDNDLIILCMMRTTKTFILRDARDRKGDPRLAEYPSELGKMCLLDVDGLKARLEQTYNITPTDFSIICLLLGNDFIPTTPVGREVTNCLDTSLELYKILKENKPKTEAGKKDPVFALLTSRIKWDDLFVFLSQLAKPEREKQMLAKVYSREEYSNSERNTGYEGKPPLVIERTIALHESTTLTLNAEPEVNVDKFRDLYWKKIFPGIEKSSEFGEVILSVVDTYLQTMVWSSMYYALGVHAVNEEFYMPYYYAPTLVEVVEVMKTYRFDAHARWEALPTDTSGKSLNPLEVLITILPLPVLNDVLYKIDLDENDEIKQKVLLPLRDLYPTQVDIDGEGFSIPDKAIVRLPFVDPDRIREVAKALRRPDIAAIELHEIRYPFAEQKSGKTKTGRTTGHRKKE